MLRKWKLQYIWSCMLKEIRLQQLFAGNFDKISFLELLISLRNSTIGSKRADVFNSYYQITDQLINLNRT